MRLSKEDKLKFGRMLYGLGLTQCSEHSLPLVRHVNDFGEGCWDCPADGCGHHIHEFGEKPWSVLDREQVPHA